MSSTENTGPIEHFCVVCGKPAIWGFNVSILKGKPGTWYCSEHKPEQ